MSNKSAPRSLPHHKVAEASQSDQMDDLMSDPAQPFSAGHEAENKPNPTLWDVKVYREERKNILARLSDRDFSSSEIPPNACEGWIVRGYCD